MDPLPGLTFLPVNYGTPGIPLNLPYPRPMSVVSGQAVTRNAMAPWPSWPYGYQHRALGSPIDTLLQTPGLFAIGGMVGGYLLSVAQIYAFSKLFQLDLSARTIWLGGLAIYGMQAAAMFITGAVMTKFQPQDAPTA